MRPGQPHVPRYQPGLGAEAGQQEREHQRAPPRRQVRAAQGVEGVPAGQGAAGTQYYGALHESDLAPGDPNYAAEGAALVSRVERGGRPAPEGRLSIGVGPADGTPGPEQQALTADLGRRLAQLLRNLSDMHREIVVLRVAVGLSAEEVGGALGMSAGAVKC